MNTQEIMQLALDMVGMNEIPGDSAIYVEGDGIEKVIMGIDMGPAGVLLGKQLGCDAAIAHHPQGGEARINFHHVVDKHVDQMVAAGVPREEAQEAVRRLREGQQLVRLSSNIDEAPSFARVLNMPFLNIHNPLDEIGRLRMDEVMQRAAGKGAKVKDLVDALYTLPEFKNSPKTTKVFLGDPENPAGKVVVSHAAGTNGGYEVARTYYKYGVGTVIYIHLEYGELEKLRADGVGNLIITGHNVGDNVGIYPFISELERHGVTVIRMGGI